VLTLRNTAKKKSGGASLIEYGLLTGLISVVSIVAVYSIGEEVSNSYLTTANVLSDKLSGIQKGISEEPSAEEPVFESLATVKMLTDTYVYNSTTYTGWQSVGPSWGTKTGSSTSNDAYEILGLFSISNSSSIIKFPGDHRETDFSNIYLSCEHGRWPISETSHNYVESSDLTELRWSSPNEYPVFLRDTHYECTVDHSLTP
jgi:Flp pilus assembly pilin Flp